MTRDEPSTTTTLTGWAQLRLADDWWAVWIGGLVLAAGLAVVMASTSGDGTADNPLPTWFAKPGPWIDSPLQAFLTKNHAHIGWGLLGAYGVSLLGFGSGVWGMGKSSFGRFAIGFQLLFFLALIAYLMAAQEVIKSYNLEYALWALLLGLLLSNTIGAPNFARPAMCTELYIKTGLVLLGAEILFSHLVALGLPGVFVAWVVTPIVLITTYWFGQRILRIESRSLNMVISADMSVCGVSAAIATAAACRAKKEELTLAIAMSLSFTVVMMVLMPAVIRAMGIDQVVAGAWLGGTIDATGAVAAAGEMVGQDALKVAATVKMIQNVLIGVMAFAVAVFWVTRIENRPGDQPRLEEIWSRFPKFILGFLAASIAFSLLFVTLDHGDQIVNGVLSGSKTLRGWFFCLAFVSIGLETNFRELARVVHGGKPLILYLAGQTLNLCLTLLMAWLMFTKVFPDAAAEMLRR